jgi:hypothetical protein
MRIWRKGVLRLQRERHRCRCGSGGNVTLDVMDFVAHRVMFPSFGEFICHHDAWQILCYLVSDCKSEARKIDNVKVPLPIPACLLVKELAKMQASVSRSRSRPASIRLERSCTTPPFAGCQGHQQNNAGRREHVTSAIVEACDADRTMYGLIQKRPAVRPVASTANRVPGTGLPTREARSPGPQQD